MSDKNYFEEAKRNMKNKVSGFDAGAVQFFAESHTTNASSNDPSHVEETSEQARKRMSRSGSGQGVSDVGFFAHTGEKNNSSNDKNYVENMVSEALGRQNGETK